MAYTMFLNGVQMPVTPSKLTVKIKGQNKTLTLVNDGEINFLRSPGLTEITVEVLLPMLQVYPFANYPSGYCAPDYYLGKFESMIAGKKPAQFILSRYSPSNGRLPSFYNQRPINTVLAMIKGHVLEPVVILTATYGLRRSEVLGLKWSALDFDDRSVGDYGSLVVRHTVKRVGNKTIRKDQTKSTTSLRTLPLTENIAIYLKRLYAHQKQMQIMCKKGYFNNDYICKWEDGHLLRPDYVSEAWRELLVRLKMPHIRFHDLRHPYVKAKTQKSLKQKFSLATLKMLWEILVYYRLLNQFKAVCSSFSNAISTACFAFSKSSLLFFRREKLS